MHRLHCLALALVLAGAAPASAAEVVSPFTHVPLGPNVFIQLKQQTPNAVADLMAGYLSSVGVRLGHGGLAGPAHQRILVWQKHEEDSGSRVLVYSEVCLRMGYLEHLMANRSAEKEHESILVADINALHIHVGLIAIGAKFGKPVQFQNDKGEEEFKPATGDKIRVLCRYEENGKLVTVPAQQWIREAKTKKPLAYDWVFAGSKFFPDPEGKRPPYYGANQGRVICTSNFGVALLDLPILSTDRTDQGLQFECNTEPIPPLQTKVTIILERK
jgi:hypothetical protein